MKKILTLPTVIVFLMSVLVAGGCNREGDDISTRGPKTVTIKLKAIKRNGGKHLKMHDSNKPSHKVVDTLETVVIPGDTVVWKLRFLSGIKNIERIGPQTAGVIIIEDAVAIPGTKNFMLKIPDDAPRPSKREKYDIVFVDKKDKTWPIDPHLIIPR